MDPSQLDDQGVMPRPTTGPILVLMADISKDKIAVTFPCQSALTPKESPEWIDEWFRSGKFDRILLWLERHCGPDCICDECGERMRKELSEEDIPSLTNAHLVFLTASGSKAYFLCEWCSERWKASDTYAPPKVMAKAMAGIDYRKRADA